MLELHAEVRLFIRQEATKDGTNTNDISQTSRQLVVYKVVN